MPDRSSRGRSSGTRRGRRPGSPRGRRPAASAIADRGSPCRRHRSGTRSRCPRSHPARPPATSRRPIAAWQRRPRRKPIPAEAGSDRARAPTRQAPSRPGSVTRFLVPHQQSDRKRLEEIRQGAAMDHRSNAPVSTSRHWPSGSVMTSVVGPTARLGQRNRQTGHHGHRTAAVETEHMPGMWPVRHQRKVVAEQVGAIAPQPQRTTRDEQLGSARCVEVRDPTVVEPLQELRPAHRNRPAVGCPGRPASCPTVRCPGTCPARPAS